MTKVFEMNTNWKISAMHRESNREDIELNINTSFVLFTRFSKYILALMIIIYTSHFCKSVFVNEIDKECLF